MTIKISVIATVMLAVLPALTLPVGAQSVSVSPIEAKAIAKEAYIYGAPMVQGYGAMFAYAIYKDNPQYKAPFNQIANVGRVFTPEDTAIIAPNSDTPYSFLWADLRAEPLVLHVPSMQKNRYWSIQFADLYTWNYAYAGTRTTGNNGGTYLLAGPGWKGEVPKGITKVFRTDTEFTLLGYRTQLFNEADIGNVRKIQAGYTVEPLSKFLHEAAPPATAKLDFPPYVPARVETLAFFDYLNFLLQFSPTIPADETARKSFAKIGVVPGVRFDPNVLTPEMQAALQAGMAEGREAVQHSRDNTPNAAGLFGTREYMKNSYLNRATGGEAGIYGNSKEEAYYFPSYVDAKGATLDGAKNAAYTMHFDKGHLPPVNAFWSVTVYDGTTKLLSANPIHRYLINSPMVPKMKLDKQGGVTIYMQKDSPGKGKEANWLPVPDGPFFLILRCYWPEQAILDGAWESPKVVSAK